MKEKVESIESDDVLSTADRFDAFVSDMQRNPVTKEALDQYIDSY